MNQELLHHALGLVHATVISFRNEGQWEGAITLNQDDISWEDKSKTIFIKLHQEWMGSNQCSWPNCEGRAYQNYWSVSDGTTTVIIPEMMLHYAEAGHWISYTDMSKENQSTLLTLFGLI